MRGHVRQSLAKDGICSTWGMWCWPSEGDSALAPERPAWEYQPEWTDFTAPPGCLFLAQITLWASSSGPLSPPSGRWGKREDYSREVVFQ